MIASAYKETNTQEIKPAVLQKILGTSTAQAYRYFSLLNATPELIELVKINKISNLKVIDEISSIKDKQEKENLMNRIRESSDPITSITSFKDMLGASKIKQKIAKNPSINLGKLVNKNLARELFQIILQDNRMVKHQSNFENINWASEMMINKAFKNLINLLRKEIV